MDIAGIILSLLQIALVSIMLSVDNVGAIALAIRNLPDKEAKKANLVGISGALGIRLIFAIFCVKLLEIQWLPIKLAAGLLLLYVTWNFINPKENNSKVKSEASFWKAVASILFADISMSLDNVLSMVSMSNDNIWLVVYGMVVSSVVIFFCAEFVNKLMQKFKIVIYIGAAVLVHTAFSMIVEDAFIEPYLTHLLTSLIPWVGAIIMFSVGLVLVLKDRKQSNKA
jgi:YjbE family integral membrane protein